MDDDEAKILHYECRDSTGKFNTLVVVRKIQNMHVGFYADFDKLTSIAPTEHLIKLNSIYILQNLLANKTGAIPFVKFVKREIFKSKKNNA